AMRRMMVQVEESRKAMEVKKGRKKMEKKTRVGATTNKNVWIEKNRPEPKQPPPQKKLDKKKSSGSSSLTRDTEEAFLKSLPSPIVLQLGRKPFDIRECLRTTKVE